MGVELRCARLSNLCPRCFGLVGSWWEVTATEDVREAGPRNYLVQPPPLNSERGCGRGVYKLLTGAPLSRALPTPTLYHRGLSLSSHCWYMGTSVSSQPDPTTMLPSEQVSCHYWNPGLESHTCMGHRRQVFGARGTSPHPPPHKDSLAKAAREGPGMGGGSLIKAASASCPLGPPADWFIIFWANAGPCVR